MNLRKITLRYMGWCPGVKSAARFIPERDISSKIFLLSAVAFVSIIAYSGYTIAQYYLRPPETGPLMVTIYDKKDPEGTLVTYPDDMFDESFNYSELRDRRIEFNIRFEKDFSKTGGSKTLLEFENLDDVWNFLEDLNTPRIVIGFTKWLTNGTFEDVYKRFYGLDPREMGEYGGTREISLLFGAPEYGHGRCRFEVSRDYRIIWIVKRYMYTIGNFPVIWLVEVKLIDAPPFLIDFNRNPFYT